MTRGRNKYLRPSKIRFTQDTISNFFQNGDSVNAAIPKLEQGHLKPEDFMAIRIVELDGKIYSLDNRRLYLFRVGEYRGIISHIPVQYVNKLPFGRFTTKNDGMSVTLRRGITKDHYRKPWLLAADDRGQRNIPKVFDHGRAKELLLHGERNPTLVKDFEKNQATYIRPRATESTSHTVSSAVDLTEISLETKNLTSIQIQAMASTTSQAKPVTSLSTIRRQTSHQEKTNDSDESKSVKERSFQKINQHLPPAMAATSSHVLTTVTCRRHVGMDNKEFTAIRREERPARSAEEKPLRNHTLPGLSLSTIRKHTSHRENKNDSDQSSTKTVKGMSLQKMDPHLPPAMAFTSSYELPIVTYRQHMGMDNQGFTHISREETPALSTEEKPFRNHTLPGLRLSTMQNQTSHQEKRRNVHQTSTNAVTGTSLKESDPATSKENNECCGPETRPRNEHSLDAFFACTTSAYRSGKDFTPITDKHIEVVDKAEKGQVIEVEFGSQDQSTESSRSATPTARPHKEKKNRFLRRMRQLLCCFCCRKHKIATSEAYVAASKNSNSKRD